VKREKERGKILEPIPGYRCGYITIAGRPNVGKSTLLNQILGQKIAIISPKPNTTRNRILGVKTLKDAQLIFWDTPGIHQAKKELNQYMVQQALKSAKEADLIYLMIEANQPWQEEDLFTLKQMEPLEIPLILLINKIDLVKKTELLPMIDYSQKLADFREIIPISALYPDGIELLLRATVPYLPESPPLFPEDMFTDQAERFWVSELIREKIFQLTHQEVPYSTAVVIEEWKESPSLLRIRAIIFVERKSQKGIIIGEKGQMIKKIGTFARQEIEFFLGTKVYLELRVKLSKNWTKDPLALKRMGYR